MPEDPQPTPPQPEPQPPAPPAPEQPPAPAGPPPPSQPEPVGEPLGEPGIRALHAERDARAQAERRAQEAERERDELKRAQETEAERMKREAEEGRRLGAEGVARLKQAHTITALAQAGLTGPKAQAALRLVDGIAYDPTTQQPTNLSERLEAAKAIYGAETFQGATPAPPPSPGDPVPAPGFPPVHQGPRQTPDPNEDQQFDTFMRTHFPQTVQPNSG